MALSERVIAMGNDMAALGSVNYTRNGDINLAYRLLSDGSDDVLFVLPWISNLDVITQYPPVIEGLEVLAGIGRVIMFDRRGTGLSDRLCGPATLEEGMDDMLAVLDAVGAGKVTLVGMHEAGTLCMMFAATHPERVSQLALYGTFATTTWKPDYPWGQKKDERDAQIEFVLETWGTFSAQGLGNPSVAEDEEFLDWTLRWARGAVSRDAAPAFFEILEHTDVREILGSIRVPTLILHRTASDAVPIGNAHYLHEKIPGSKLVELPGEDYFPFLGDWRALVGEIEEFITGTRRMFEQERVLATIMFCDVVDSSKLVSELGDARWRGILDQLDGIVAASVRDCGGQVIKSLGDGYLVTFDRPARGIRSACLIRDEVKRLGIPLRFGIHTGEVEVRGDDIGGVAVHIASRVLDRSSAGEVLVSGAVPPLIAGSGLEFTPLGIKELRGIPGEWPLFALV